MEISYKKYESDSQESQQTMDHHSSEYNSHPMMNTLSIQVNPLMTLVVVKLIQMVLNAVMKLKYQVIQCQTSNLE